MNEIKEDIRMIHAFEFVIYGIKKVE